MATCDFSEEDTLPLDGNTTYTGHLAGFGDTVTYSFTMIENETITFNIRLTNDPGSGTLPDGKLTLFRWIDGEWSNLGISYLRYQVNSFTYDGIVGDYYFCLENLYPCDYEVLVEFTDYNGIVFDRMYAHSGESGDGDWPIVEREPCGQQVAFSISSGKLPLDISNVPEDFTFESSGLIYGTPGEQDCEIEDWEVPSWNWKKYDEESGITAIGKEYRIIFKAYFVDYPWVSVEKEYKVCVHNNWSLDPADILNLQRTEYDVSYVDVEVPDQSPLCLPCVEEKKIVTERIIKWKEYDIAGFLAQLDNMTYNKQCAGRHKLPELDDVYHEAVQVEDDIELCPVCTDDK